VAVGVIVGVPVLSLGFYLAFGQPELPDQPLAARTDKPASDLTMAEAIGRIEAHLAKEPEERPTAAATVERLMQIQPQLPARSRRSLMALQTMLLSESQQGQGLQGAPTYVLPYNRPGTRSATLLPAGARSASPQALRGGLDDGDAGRNPEGELP
jgi:hypothetical protein